jgi:hypothetical protein
MGYLGRQTVHGFREIASTWANEAERYKSDWIEMALAHDDEDEVRGAYNSALYLTPRRRMLQDWASMVEKAAEAAPGPPLVANMPTVLSPLGTHRRRVLPPRPLRTPYWQQPSGANF